MVQTAWHGSTRPSIHSFIHPPSIKGREAEAREAEVSKQQMRRASWLHRIVLCCVASTSHQHRIASHRIAYLVCSFVSFVRWRARFVRYARFVRFPRSPVRFSSFSHLSPFGTRSARRQTLQSFSSPSHPALPTRLGTYRTRQTPRPLDLLSSSATPSRQVSTSWYMPQCYNTCLPSEPTAIVHVVVIPVQVPPVIPL